MKPGNFYEWDFSKGMGETRTRTIIMDLVCKEFDCTPEQMRSPDKKRFIADARGVYAYLCRKYLSDTMVRIGMELNREHSAVTRRLQQIAGFIEMNDAIVNKIRRIENNLLIK